MTPAQWAQVLGAGERATWTAGDAVKLEAALAAMRRECEKIAKETE